MFDIGFSEMMVIAVVALVVIGPERLPKVARTLGHLMGRMQRYVNDVKADINREIELEELRKFKQEFETTASTFESSVKEELRKTEDVFSSAAREVTDAAGATAPATPNLPPSFDPLGHTLADPLADPHAGLAPLAEPPVHAATPAPIAPEPSPPVPTAAPGPETPAAPPAGERRTTI